MTFCRLASSLLAISLLAAPALAHAQSAEDRAAAHTEFERGVAAYTAHDFQTALDAFQEAYRLAPHASVRLNIANCYAELGRPVEALFHFEHYLTEATGLTAAQRRDVQASIDRLEASVGTITLAVTPDGAAITIDGSDTRRAPVTDPVRVVAGDHIVDIVLDGYVSEHQTVHVEGGGNARISLRLRRAEAVASTGGTGAAGASGGTTGAAGTTTTTTVAETTTSTATVTATPDTTTTTTETATTTSAETTVEMVPVGGADHGDDGGGGGIRVTLPVWIAGAVTAAALIGWAIAGPVALAENSAFETAVVDANDPLLTEAQRADARASGFGHADAARSAALASDILLVTTLVGAGATTFFFILAQTESDDSESADSSTSLLVMPVVGPGYAGAAAVGSF